MFYLRQTYLLIREVRILTDLLAWGQNNGSAFHVFKLLGVHDGIHEVCPGWCPCSAYDSHDGYLRVEDAA